MNLNEIAVFVKVVETGSFTNAAKVLDLPRSTVSARLTSLEKRLRVNLIRRTTRKLSVTEAGRIYYQQCLAALKQINEAESELSQGQTAPHGLLRITTPVDFGASILPSILSEFSRKYPKVNLELILTDKNIDLVAENIDLGIRIGALKDSSMIAKKLGSIYFAPFASPRYLKTHGNPKGPKDLEKHSCLQFTALGPEEWQLTGTRMKETVKLTKHIMINDLNLIKLMAISGDGIALLPTFLCSKEVKEGKLIRILGNWKSNVRSVQFVYPSQKFMPPKLSLFIEVAYEHIKQKLQSAEL